MAAGDFFGGLDLGAKYGVVLAGLFFVVVAVGFGRLWVVKRREKLITAKMRAKAEEEEEGLVRQGIPLTDRVENEADLFGIRAIERGFTGGVAQATPSRENLDGESMPTLTVEDVLKATKRIPYGKNPANPLFAQTTGVSASTPQDGSASGSGGEGTDSSTTNLPPPRSLTPVFSPASRTAAMQAAALLPTPPPPGEQVNTSNQHYLRVPDPFNDGFIGGFKLHNMEKTMRPPSPLQLNRPPTPPQPPQGSQHNIQSKNPEENVQAPPDSGNGEIVAPPPGNHYVRPYSWQMTRSREFLSVPARDADQTLRLPFQSTHTQHSSPIHSAPEPGSFQIVLGAQEASSTEDCSCSTSRSSSFTSSIHSEEGDIGVIGRRLGPAAYTGLIRTSGVSFGDFYDSYYGENATPRQYAEADADDKEEESQTAPTYSKPTFVPGHARKYSRMPSRVP